MARHWVTGHWADAHWADGQWIEQLDLISPVALNVVVLPQRLRTVAVHRGRGGQPMLLPAWRKDPYDRVLLTADWGAFLGAEGPAIIACTAGGVDLLTGEDVTAMLLWGVATVTDTRTSALIIEGEPGKDYMLTYRVELEDGQRFAAHRRIMVRDAAVLEVAA